MTIARRTLFSGLAAAAANSAMPAHAADTPRRGGILKVYAPDSPASMSLFEETTVSVIAPMTGVFNNLIVFDPHIPRNSMQTIVPDLATAWSWSDDGKRLDFTLRTGVTWHDGKPFSANDVVHTWNLILGKSEDKPRLNPRAPWYANVQQVVASGDDKVSFHLERPQAALLMLLASAGAPIFPSHVLTRDLRTHPIGTGPYRFVEFKRGEVIRVARNPNYWKPGLPYLDGIEWHIVPNRATAILGFVSGKFDMTFPSKITMPLLHDMKAQLPNMVVHIGATAVAGNVTLNHTTAPFNDPKIRRALALTLDRSEFVRIMTEDSGLIGGAMLPPPYGVWGMPEEVLKTIEFYGPNVEKRREEARQIMASLGYGPNKHLEITVGARQLAEYRDAAVILIDQLRPIWIDGTLEVVDTAVWDSKMVRRNFQAVFNQTGTSVDDPDVTFFENYKCGTIRNFPGYCDPEMDKLFLAQSMESDQEKRRQLVWEIDKKIQMDAVRPVLYHDVAATCWHPRLHGLTPSSNSQYNGWRMEDIWLDS